MVEKSWQEFESRKPCQNGWGITCRNVLFQKIKRIVVNDDVVMKVIVPIWSESQWYYVCNPPAPKDRDPLTTSEEEGKTETPSSDKKKKKKKQPE